jgi:putative RecB family exonuclease
MALPGENSMNHSHLSYSQITCYLACPLKYRFSYVEHIPPEFTPASLAFGSAVHEAVAAYHGSRIGGDPLKPDHMLDVFRQSWRSREADVKFFNGDSAASLESKANQLLCVFHESVDPTCTILGVEERFEMPMSNGTPPLVGFIDLIEQSQDGTTIIVDLKTASKRPTDFQVHNNMQLTCYSLGAAALGFDPDNIRFRLDVLLKTKNPELIRLETIRTDRNRQRFGRLVHEVWNGIQSGIAFPKEDWHCAQCAYAQTCKEW